MQGSMRLKLFSLNDYMGLSQHPAICKAAADAATQCGMGMLLLTAMHQQIVMVKLTHAALVSEVTVRTNRP